MNSNAVMETRSTPPFMVAAALLFWGYEVDWLLVAAPMAAAVEAGRWVGAKWEFSDKDLNRIWDLCMVLLLGALIIRYTAGEKRNDSGYQLFQWFPLVFLPLILGQVYGNREQFPMTAFSWVARHNKRISGRESSHVDVGYAYFVLCLISAGAANKREGGWFFAGICSLAAWALWTKRSKRFPAAVWAGSFAAVVILAFQGQLGLLASQRYAEANVPTWFTRYLRRDSDGAESSTGLGQIGRVKASDEIIMRVHLDTAVDTTLLRLASFNELLASPNSPWTWFARTTRFQKMRSECDGSIWRVDGVGIANEAITVFASLPKRRSLLALPKGTARIQDLPVATLEYNLFGTVRVTEPPGFVAYQAWFEQNPPPASRADQRLDLAIPNSERQLLQEVAEELTLANLEPMERVRKISSYIGRNFRFSLYVPENAARGPTNSPLQRFLTQTHSGHCEYFATATVLLLRQAGIPARYVTGYALQERALNGLFIVRDRHLHAWAEYWMEDHWEDLDTTPNSWNQAESLNPSRYQWLWDWFSDLIFRFQKWRWLGEENWIERFAPLIVAPFALWLLWRVFFRKRTVSRDQGQAWQGGRFLPGTDSEFYWIERHLTAWTDDRPQGSTLSEWLQFRLKGGSQAEMSELTSLLRLHYRYRFDPAGLTEDERAQLREGAVKWLTRKLTTQSRSALKGPLRG